MDATFVKTDGCEAVTPSNKTNFSLEELQALVGGCIEVVRLQCDYIMIVHEEGKLMGFEINPIATYVAQEHGAIKKNDYIVGDVIICHKSMVK